MIEKFISSRIHAFAKNFDKAVGLENIAVLHINDSKTPRDSQHDRHENIGKGYIGISGFRALMREPAFLTIPWILETPRFAKEGPDKKNMEILKKLRG